MIHSKENYEKQAQELIERTQISEKEFDILYRAALGEEIENIDALVEKVIKALFLQSYGNEIILPWDFFNTPLGEVVAAVKFKTEKVYLINEIAEMTGYSVPYINKELKNGNLEGQKRGGTWIINESSVIKYMDKKGKVKGGNS